ncbi:crossover junction endodeoxyribonuclease RuvC [bacterium]|nr:crossover junction endodeoxyribonuclease RuvC [bacterium]
MIILGIDPGLAKVGWSVVEGPRRLSLLACGTWTSLAKDPLENRLRTLAAFVRGLAAAHDPERLALEWGGFRANTRQSLVIGTAVGAIISSLPDGVQTIYLTPAQIKSGITGYGRAEKGQVAYMVAQQVSLPPEADDHATDAVAIAITAFGQVAA